MIEAKKVGLDRVMLDCDVNNLGSDKTLKALGGKLERTGIDPSDGTKLDGFIALRNNEIIGLITYMVEANECEICSLNSFIENKGIGTALINKVKEYAKKNSCSRIKLITTNDNIRGLEFYQKRGFTFSNLFKNSIEEYSRKLKPQIPLYADNGLPIRDEIELEMIIM